MCMLHEPEGFRPTTVGGTMGALKNHFPVSRSAPSGPTCSVKVNWRSFNFTATSRKQFFAEMCGFPAKMHFFEAPAG